MDPGNKIHGREHLEAMLERAKREIGETMSDIPSKLEDLHHLAHQIERCQCVLDSDAETVKIYARNNLGDACDDVPLSAISRDLDAFRRRQIRRLRAGIEAITERCEWEFGSAWEEPSDE